MPELPEVETVRRGLAGRLSSFQIHDVEILRDRAIASPGGSLLFTQALKGTWVGQWHRRGKYLYADLHDGPDHQQVAERGHWGVHLRMTGQFLWLDEATEPCRHTRVRFWDPKGRELRFIDMRSFGEMWWVPPEQPLESVITGLRRLGPEPFSDAFNGAYLQQRLKNSRRSIKAALLDQSLVAGAGNIYADESLFAAGIAPHTAAGAAEAGATQRTLHLFGGCASEKYWRRRNDLQRLQRSRRRQWQLRWAGLRLPTHRIPCLSCGTPIVRDKLAGRSTHWCPNCQR